MKTGFNFSKIIDESFYQKTYVQNQVMGACSCREYPASGWKMYYRIS